MINFEEELKKYHPIAGLESLEELVQKQDLTDMADIMHEMMKEGKGENRSVSVQENSANGKRLL